MEMDFSDPRQHQIVLLNKVMLALEIYIDLSKNNYLYFHEHDWNRLSVDDRLRIDVTFESMRMFIINYLHALVGRGEYDKVSIYHHPPLAGKESVSNFYSKRKKEIKLLKTLRNNLYSHLDPDIFKDENFPSKDNEIPILSLKCLVSDLCKIIFSKENVEFHFRDSAKSPINFKYNLWQD